MSEAYVKDVSTRKVEDLMQTLGITGISKSEVSRICGELDERVAAFRGGPLLGEDCDALPTFNSGKAAHRERNGR